jgi:RNA polymerase sigma factor (sigma-70 family)
MNALLSTFGMPLLPVKTPPKAQPAAVRPPARPQANKPLDLHQDPQWLAGFKAGDNRALERVFRTYAPYVLAVLRGGYVHAKGGQVTVRDRASQEDLLQEVFVRALSPASRARYDGVRPYAAFLRAIAGNVMLEHVRAHMRAQARFTSDDTALDDAWTPEQPLPDAVFLSRQEQALGNAFFGTLSDELRAFVQARFVDGLSQRDAAEFLGLGRQQVRTLEKVARARLEEFLAQLERV